MTWPTGTKWWKVTFAVEGRLDNHWLVTCGTQRDIAIDLALEAASKWYNESVLWLQTEDFDVTTCHNEDPAEFPEYMGLIAEEVWV